MSNQELPKISNPVQNLFDKVKQKIGGSPSTQSLSSTDFDVALTPPSSFKPKRGLKRKPEDDVVVIPEDTDIKRPLSKTDESVAEDQIGKIKYENETVEIKDEVSDEGNDENGTTERPRQRRNRSVPTIIPPIFLNTPMLLRSELSQKKSTPIEKAKGKEKLRSSSVTSNPRCTATVYTKDKSQKSPPQKINPSKKPSTEIDDVLFVSEEVKSQGDGDKPSLKLLIRQKRKSDPIQADSSVDQRVDEKPDKFEQIESEEDKNIIPVNINLNNNNVDKDEEMKKDPLPLPQPPSEEVSPPPSVDVGTITDQSFLIGANEVVDEYVQGPQETETMYVEIIELLEDEKDIKVNEPEPEPEPPLEEEPPIKKEPVAVVAAPSPELPSVTPEEPVVTPEVPQVVTPEVPMVIPEVPAVTPEVPAVTPEGPKTTRKRGRPSKKHVEAKAVTTVQPEIEKPQPLPQKITRSSRSAPQIVVITPQKTPAKRKTRATPKTTPRTTPSKKKAPSPKEPEVKPMVTRRSAMKVKEEPKKERPVKPKTRPKQEKKVEEKNTKTVTRSQKKIQSKNVVEKPKKAEVKVLAKISPLVKSNKKKATLTVNKKQKGPAKKPKVTKTTATAVKKVVQVEKPKQPVKPEVISKEKRRPKILKPISLKSNTMLIATIVKTTLEQLSAQKKLMKKSKLKQRTLGKKEETDQAHEETKSDLNETNTVDNVISQVKEILAKDPRIMNSIVEDSTAEKSSEDVDQTQEDGEPAPNPALKKLYSVIPDVPPRPRGRKPNCTKSKSDSPSSPTKVTLPTEIITRNEEKLINDIEALKSECTEDLRQRPVDESKGDMGVFDFDEFDPEPEEVPHSYKVIKESNSELDDGSQGDRTPMKQATIFEMFDRVLIKNKRLSVTRTVFEGHSSKDTTVIAHTPRPPSDSKRKSTEGGSMPPPAKRLASGEEEDEFDDDDSRKEWMPEELAEYKMKYTAKKEMGGYKPVYKCKICLLVLPTYYKLYKHKEEHVKTQNPYNCKQCDASFGNVNDLVAHIRVHKGKHPYVCQKCDLGFWSKKAYDDHIPIHLLRRVKEPPKKFQCDVCGKRFPKICDIERHVRVHTGEKPFVCNICNKPFQQAHNLSKHLLIHLHLKPFSCEICGKQFGRVDVLNRHVLTHSVKKPVECWICPKDFIRHSQLSHHVQKEHPEAMDTEIARELFGAHKRRGPVPRRLTDYDSAEGEAAPSTAVQT